MLPNLRYNFAFFFFQAEDGIRDLYVTGVQTCALPISMRLARVWKQRSRRGLSVPFRPDSRMSTSLGWSTWTRSEERRVGKECRSRWSSYYNKKIIRNSRYTQSYAVDVFYH